MKLFTELKERSILQVCVVYVAAAWVLVQVADTLFETFDAPDWVMKVLVLMLVAGFPVAVILAWAQGLRKQETVPPELSVGSDTSAGGVGIPASERPATNSPISNKSIAVLAFEDMSPDRDHEYFSDGMSEEILNLLARIPDLVVIGRTSSFSFKGKNASIPEIGAALNVAHVLEGSVRKSGSKVRITVQLIKVDGGFHLWSDSYDRELEDVFQVQDEIAHVVTRKLESTLLEKKEPPARQIPDNIEAYELVLQGLHFTNRGIDGIQQSLDYFQRALAVEPGYSRAHEGLSRYYLMAGIWGFMPSLEAIPKIKDHCRSALASNPGSAVSYARLASAAMVLEWDWPEARRNLAKAISLGSNDAYIQFVLSQWYLMCGNETQASACIEAAVALDPLNLFQLWMRADIDYTFGHYERAEARMKQVLGLDPHYSDAIRVLAMLLIRKGELDTALDLAQQSYELQKHGAGSSGTLARAYIALGKEAEARELLKQTIEAAESASVLYITPANIYAALGDLDKGFEWLEKAYAYHDQSFRLMRVHPSWDDFRYDPRFSEFQERMNFPNGELE